jgi:pectin methylesterase-like acyl-CoA thioesterase
MSAGKILFAILIVAAFAGGIYIGSSGDRELVITQRSLGVSYSGGFAGEAGALAQSVGNVAARTREGQVHIVDDGESIMEAVKRAAPGDTIQVMPGTYHETVYVDKDDIRIIGIILEDRRATLDGRGVLNDAILYSGNNFVVENLRIVQYKGNAIMGQAGNNFEIRNNIIDDTGGAQLRHPRLHGRRYTRGYRHPDHGRR